MFVAHILRYQTSQTGMLSPWVHNSNLQGFHTSCWCCCAFSCQPHIFATNVFGALHIRTHSACCLLQIQAYFVGQLSTALHMLSTGGLLNPAWLEPSVLSSAVYSRAHLDQPPLRLQPSSIPGMPAAGVTVKVYPNYYEAMMHVRRPPSPRLGQRLVRNQACT